MPIYGYKCTACGKPCEKLQKFGDGPPAECPECGERGTLERQLSTGTGFCLMGRGWDKPGMSVSKRQ